MTNVQHIVGTLEAAHVRLTAPEPGKIGQTLGNIAAADIPQLFRDTQGPLGAVDRAVGDTVSLAAATAETTKVASGWLHSLGESENLDPAVAAVDSMKEHAATLYGIADEMETKMSIIREHLALVVQAAYDLERLVHQGIDTQERTVADQQAALAAIDAYKAGIAGHV